MCVSYCHRQGKFYWNHLDCEPTICDFAAGPYQACASCLHRAGEMCGLTRAPLPAGKGGCCHHGVAALVTRAEVSRLTLEMLSAGQLEAEEFILIWNDVPYQRDAKGRLLVTLDDLALPLTYGRGTDHLSDEVIDWSDWFEQWS